MSNLLEPYTAPEWAKSIRNIPTVKVQLAHVNTPIHTWDIPGLPEGVSVSIKRDDMTGSTLTGSKVRKLEFQMADALLQNCKHVITGGSVRSNHCRGVAVSARRLGLIPHFIMYPKTKTAEVLDCYGNVLLHRLCGSNIYIKPKKGSISSEYRTELSASMDKLAAKIQETCGQKSYQIPLGGWGLTGMFGDISLFSELMEQGVLTNFDDLVCASGSGATAAGLAIANILTGSKLKDCGLTMQSEDILNIVDSHVGQGYGVYTQGDVDFMRNVGSSTGIMLDPVYTAKAAKGLVHELNNNPGMFKGNRILFLHTGGLFGLYDETMFQTLSEKNGVTKPLPDSDRPLCPE